MSDKSKKDEPAEEEHVSFGVGDEQVIGFVQEPDGHGFSEEFLAEREAAMQRERAHAIASGVILDVDRDDAKPAKKAVAMDTGAQSSGGSK